MSSNTNIGNTPVNQGYVQLVHMGETGGIDGTLRTLYDGDGTASDLQIASNKVKISTELFIGSKTITEYVQDVVGTMFTTGSYTNITTTYDDTNGNIDLSASGEVTLTGSQTLTNKTLTSPVINTGISGSAILDSDTMSGASATTLSSSESIKAYVDTEVAGIVSSAPSTLDTLNELAAALGDDANFSTTVTNSIATKLPLAGGQMTGNITFSGSQTVDGRDVSADGSKLDGIEASATADQSNAEIRTAVEAATDSNVFTDADHSKLNAIEASADVTDTANVTSAGALMDSEVTDLDGIKSLTVPNDTTISATAKTLLDDANVGAMRDTLGLGTLAQKSEIDDIDQIAAGVKLVAGESFVDSDDNLMTAAAIDDRINSAVSASTYSFTLSDGSNTQPIASGNTLTMTGSTGIDVVVGATDTATLTFDGSELPDMTDLMGGTDEFIVLDGTTSKRKAANEIRLTTFDDTGFSHGAVTSYTDTGDNRVLTSGGGTTINGEANLTFDGTHLYLPDSSNIKFGDSQDLEIKHDGSNSIIKADGTGDLTIRQDTADKDILLRCDDGSGGIATYITLDGSISKTTLSKDLRAVDNVKITAGNADDLKIQHNGTNSFIDNEVGGLFIRQKLNDGDMFLQCDDGSGGLANYITLDGSAGTVNIDKEIHLSTHLDMGDGDRIKLGDSDDLQIVHDSNINFIHSTISDRDIYFRVNDGGASVDAIKIDASAVGRVILPNDNQKLTIGADYDLNFYNNGSVSYISNSNNTFNIDQSAAATMQIRNLSSDQDILFSVNDGGSQTEIMRLDGSTSNVGIGTASPGSKLHVAGAIQASVAENNFAFAVQNSTEANFRYRIYNDGSTTGEPLTFRTGLYYGTTENATMHFYRGGGSTGGYMTFQTNNGNERMRIDGSGNVGIGTGSPAHKLDVNGALRNYANGSAVFRTESTAAGYGAYNRLTTTTNAYDLVSLNGDFKIDESGVATRFVIKDTTGNVGIGTTSPSKKLEVAGDVRIASGGDLILSDSGGGNDTFLYNDSQTFITYVNGAERMRIASNGNMIVGSDYTTNASTKLVVSHSGANGILLNQDSSNTANSGRLFFEGTSTSAIFQEGGDFSFRINATTGSSSGTERMKIMETGMQITNASLGVNIAPNGTNGRIDASNDVVAYSTSDKRLKENIKPLDNALDKVLKISGVEFDWKELTEEEKKTIHGNKGHDVGVIAQEIEEVLPEVVTERDNGYKAVKYEKIVPLLIEAIKELKQEINELKNSNFEYNIVKE